MRFPTILSLLVVLLVGAALPGQGTKPSYADLTLVRNRPWAKESFFDVRAGAVFSAPDSENELRLAEQQTAPEGHLYLRQAQAFGREGRLDAYVGTDGAYASLTEGNPLTGRGYSRVELFGRQWRQFIREGYYESEKYIVTGSYRARDWRARLSFATQVTDTLKGEVGAFYGQNSFDTYSRSNPAFVIPDDHAVYGVTIIGEDNRLEIDRQTLLPFRGYIVNAWLTREWNDSDRLFGITGRQSSLPSAIVRGGGHLEWYFPYTNATTFVISADGAMGPKDDRVWIYDSSKPVGEIWVDGRVDLRVILSDVFTVTPGLRGQWIRIADQFAASRDDEFFFGGQLELRADFGESFALTGTYSYLSNESREPVNFSRDTLGEHRLVFVLEFRP